MTIKHTFLALSFLMPFSVAAFEAPYAPTAPVIDGSAVDEIWSKAQWQAIDQLTLGTPPSAADFSGKFKAVWTKKKLYLLAEIHDDILMDSHPDPLTLYWEDDTLEIFIDEDKSGGRHLDNHNAFAYHVSLDNQVVDFDRSAKPQTFNDHINSVWKRSNSGDGHLTWEMSIDVYSDEYRKSGPDIKPVALHAGKEMGFMVSYCDSDSTAGREHFVGSVDIEPVDGDKNRGYIDASVFGTLTLVK